MEKLQSPKRRSIIATRALIVVLGLALLGMSSLFSIVHATSPDMIPPTLNTPLQDAWARTKDITFSWATVPDAMSYELRYGAAPTCVVDPTDTNPAHAGQFVATAADTEVTTEPTKTITNLADGNWCWQVRVMRPLVGLSDWSEIRHVHIDTTAPVMTVSTSGASGHLTGTIDAPATMALLVDGGLRMDVSVVTASTANGSGTYDWSVTLPEVSTGFHTYAIRATDNAGNETTTSPISLSTAAISAQPRPVVDTHSSTLPLVATEPFVFVAPPAPIVSRDKTVSQVANSESYVVPPVATPSKIEPVGDMHQSVSSSSPVQPTEKGWVVFGVAWYWWALGAMTSAGAWVVAARVRLVTRLSWIGDAA